MNAVTVWMLTAHGMESRMRNRTQGSGFSSFCSASRVDHPMRRFRSRYPLRAIISQKSKDWGEG